ncbi:hypothetical protein Pcinc_006486 [Petrolisthes cinctipes]|uniref:Uncharacterized protein n=1 Tax=Petrolisthes cinctipes TaxID=88211 RepID=A0AAE1GAJ6_PETCI|nr:hypothetical protein Pcinc_006486 [Petrolisthes cinctipes]
MALARSARSQAAHRARCTTPAGHQHCSPCTNSSPPFQLYTSSSPTPSPSPYSNSTFYSAKKRKRLFETETESGSIESDEKSVEEYGLLVTNCDLESLLKNTLCSECLSVPTAHFKSRGRGTDSETIITCSYKENLYEINSELLDMR